MSAIASKLVQSPTSYIFVSHLYWLAFLLTECQEQSVSIVIDTLESLDDVGEISQPSAQLRLREAVIEKSIMAAPLCGIGPLSPDPLPWLKTANSCLSTQERTFSWEDVKDAMLGLEMFQRRVLLLTTFEGFSRSRTARLLGCDVTSIAEAHLNALCAFASSFTSKEGIH